MADSLQTFPVTIPNDYYPYLVWDEDAQAWVSTATLLARDGSRHHTQLVCIGMDQIYYEALT